MGCWTHRAHQACTEKLSSYWVLSSMYCKTVELSSISSCRACSEKLSYCRTLKQVESARYARQFYAMPAVVFYKTVIFWFSDYTPRFEVRPFVGDITRFDDVERCLRDADAVVHSCGLISVGINPDNDKLHAINVTGKIWKDHFCLFTVQVHSEYMTRFWLHCVLFGKEV